MRALALLRLPAHTALALLRLPAHMFVPGTARCQRPGATSHRPSRCVWPTLVSCTVRPSRCVWPTLASCTVWLSRCVSPTLASCTVWLSRCVWPTLASCTVRLNGLQHAQTCIRQSGSATAGDLHLYFAPCRIIRVVSNVFQAENSSIGSRVGLSSGNASAIAPTGTASDRPRCP